MTVIKKFIPFSRYSYYINYSIKNRPQSYGEYLKKEKIRDKKKRLKIIKEWYDFILDK